jgi:hypothetical protein
MQPLVEALQCLREVAVPFVLVRGDPEAVQTATELELLVARNETRIAFAALRRAGFREMRTRFEPATTAVFLRAERNRFHVLRLHVELAAGGLRYMDAELALDRADRRPAYPRLSREDRFLHVLMRALLAGGEGPEAVRVQLHTLRREGLAVDKLAEQTRPLRVELEVRQVLRDLDLLVQDPRRWAGLGWRVRGALLRVPGNAASAWRCFRRRELRFSFKPVVVAVMGPPGSGRKAFCAALESLLADSPLRASRVLMSSWEFEGPSARILRALVPPRVSPVRLFLARCGRPVRLSAEERLALATAPGNAALALHASCHTVRSTAFHLLVALRLAGRYARRIARSRKALVIADGWVDDLAFRFGRETFLHGDGFRRWILGRFPQPDGILYLSTPYEVAADRDPQVDAEAFASVDQGLRRLLKPKGPLELVPDASPGETARTFLHRYWAHLLERCNRHA